MDLDLQSLLRFSSCCSCCLFCIIFGLCLCFWIRTLKINTIFYPIYFYLFLHPSQDSHLSYQLCYLFLHPSQDSHLSYQLCHLFLELSLSDQDLSILKNTILLTFIFIIFCFRINLRVCFGINWFSFCI
jgi:hypothetical protein